MNAPVVVELLDAGAALPGDVEACAECCGWGFIWNEVTPGKTRPGADCPACHGTGVPWQWA
ncbi:hypothetical protein [Streptomyces sp. NPDC047981]|uniref:hypothetical protein n=1 Tax=Streptomyces sp. NPDC047981 TaxID=3154610 RepID=UPI00343EFCEC